MKDKLKDFWNKARRFKALNALEAAALILLIAAALFWFRSRTTESYDGSPEPAAYEASAEAEEAPGASAPAGASETSAAAVTPGGGEASVPVPVPSEPDPAPSAQAAQAAASAAAETDPASGTQPGQAQPEQLQGQPQAQPSLAQTEPQTQQAQALQQAPGSQQVQSAQPGVIIAGGAGVSYSSSSPGGSSGGSSTAPTEAESTEESSTEESTQPQTEGPKVLVCSLSISCEPFLADTSDAVRAKLPADGIILPSTEVEFYEGETVFDVLKRVCRAKRIPYKATTSLYGAYISSMDNLSEKYYDYSTGWCYYVDGEYALTSSDNWVLEGGESIEWVYNSWSA